MYQDEHNATIDTEQEIHEHEPAKTGMKDVNKQPLIERLRQRFKRLPDKKNYLEFITALLTIPVLLTVIISNLNTIKKQTDSTVTISPTSTPTVIRENMPKPKEMSVTNTLSPSVTATPTPTPSEQCVKEVGPVSIVYPEEGDSISKNPLCVDISRTGTDYCAVVWSYRINDESWSDYTDKSIRLYGLSAGSKTLELRVKSIVTGDETVLTRTFTVVGTTTPTSISTPISTSSATLNN